MSSRSQKKERWYLGGIAGCVAAMITHPLDLLKVHLQTQIGKKQNLQQMCVQVVRNDGFLSLYNGLSASLSRQVTYTSTRFGVYEVIQHKRREQLKSDLPFVEKVILSGVSGIMGGIVGNPSDMVNVRMQNDLKLSAGSRRNYKNIFHGLYCSQKADGFYSWMSGVKATASRGCLMTVGQIAFYEQIKQNLLRYNVMENGVPAHLVSSSLAACAATILTQPLDVIKTRMMNSSHQLTIYQIIISTHKEGTLAFFKGIIPSFLRLAPHTIITFLCLEQLRKMFPK